MHVLYMQVNMKILNSLPTVHVCINEGVIITIYLSWMMFIILMKVKNWKYYSVFSPGYLEGGWILHCI